VRTDNVIIVALGLAGVAFAVAATAWWGELATRRTPPEPTSDAHPRNAAFAAAGWSLSAVLAAGAVAGIVVGGLVGRLIMRIAAAVSEPGVQGQLTDADEVIGEITFGGTMGFLLFVGLAGGLVAALLFLVARPWLPATARASGALIGLLVMGLLGPGDPLDPDNVDFALLSNDALIVGLIVGGSLLFGLAFASLAARFDVLARSRSRSRYWLLPSYVVSLAGPVGVAVIAYLAGRTFLPGRLRPLLDRRPVQIAGQVVLALAVLVAVVRLGAVAVDIVRA
jgi:hypothetical protein